MSNCFDQPCGQSPCPPPCPPKCTCTSDDVLFKGSLNVCTGVLTDHTLTQVIYLLQTYAQNRLFDISSDSLVVTPLGSTCEKRSRIEVVPSEDEGNIFTLGSDGYPYVPAGGEGETITTEDTPTVNLSLPGTVLSADVILDPQDYNMTEETLNGLLTTPEHIADVEDELSQHFSFEVPPLLVTTFTNPDTMIMYNALKVGLGEGVNYASDYTQNNPNVKVFWNDTPTLEHTLDNEVGVGQSLSYIYPGLTESSREGYVKTYGSSYMTKLINGLTTTISGFKFYKGADLLDTIVLTGNASGTSGIYDFKGMYNLTEFTFANSNSTDIAGYPTSKKYTNVEDLRSLLRFVSYGAVEEGQKLIFTSPVLDTVLINLTTQYGYKLIRAKNKPTLNFDANASTITELDLENSSLNSLSLWNCGHFFDGHINKIILKLITPLIDADTLNTGDGVFDFDLLRYIAVTQINGVHDNTVGATRDTEILIPDLPGTGELGYQSIRQDWIKDEIFISLDNSGIVNGRAYFKEWEKTHSFGENYTNDYYNPTWSPNGGFSQNIFPQITAGTVTSIGVDLPLSEDIPYQYNSIPTITKTAGPGSGLTFTPIMTVVQQNLTTTGITVAGSGYVIGQLIVLNATGGTELQPVTIQVTSVDGGNGITGFSVIDGGEFTALPSLFSAPVGGFQYNPAAKWAIKRVDITGVSDNLYDVNTSIFQVEVSTNNGSGTGTASAAAKAAIESLHNKGWQMRW